jgi:DNA-binding CsgD family transcriptional regulator
VLIELSALVNVGLTKREREIIQLLCQGFLNKEIAYQLGITEGTVKVYMSKVYKKCPVFRNNHMSMFQFIWQDYAKKQGVRLEEWMRVYGEQLSDEAKYEFGEIRKDTVVLFKGKTGKKVVDMRTMFRYKNQSEEECYFNLSDVKTVKVVEASHCLRVVLTSEVVYLYSWANQDDVARFKQAMELITIKDEVA